MDRLLLTTSQAAETLGIGRTKLYELLGKHELRTVRIGRAVRIPAEDVRDWIQRQLTREQGAA